VEEIITCFLLLFIFIERQPKLKIVNLYDIKTPKCIVKKQRGFKILHSSNNMVKLINERRVRLAVRALYLGQN
jgi:hypothetical protein